MSSIVEKVDQTTIYVQPIHFTLSILTNILNIYVLSDRTFRLSPCTYYFLLYSIASILYSCILCPIQILRRFSILWINTPVGCKLQPYLPFVLPFLANLMLILASFDRFSSSSSSIRLRSMSNIQRARISIIIGIFFSVIFMSPMLYIYYYESNLNLCFQHFHSIIDIYIFSQIIIYYVIFPLLMSIFGLLTVLNIRQQLQRVGQRNVQRSNRQTEGQLARMLSLQICIHLIVSLPFGIVYTMNSFIPSTRTTLILGIRLIFVSWQQCDYFLPFFLYTLSSNIYRAKLFQLFRLKRSNNIVTQTNRQFPSQDTRQPHSHLNK